MIIDERARLCRDRPGAVKSQDAIPLLAARPEGPSGKIRRMNLPDLIVAQWHRLPTMAPKARSMERTACQAAALAGHHAHAGLGSKPSGIAEYAAGRAH